MILELKKYREENNLSQQKIADLLEVPRSRYQKWEDGIANPKYDDVLKIEKFLSISSKKLSIPPHKNLLPLLRDVHSVGSANTLNNSTPNGEVVEWIDAGDWFPGANAAIRHYEDSMLEYPSGCILALKEITDLKQGFILGKDYVIEYGDDWNRVTKRIQRRKDGTLMGYSTNADKYEDDTLIHQPLELHNIHRAWRVLGYVVKKESATGVVMVTGKN